MDKVAMITGATRGIGKQIALTLANEGYNIVLNYRTVNDELFSVSPETVKDFFEKEVLPRV